MHQLGISLFWLGLQVTIVTLAALVIYVGTKRLGPQIRSFLLSCSIGITLLLALLAFSPWPRWQTARKSEVSKVEITQRNANSIVSETDLDPAETPLLNKPLQESEWETVWDEFLKGLQQQPVVDQSMAIPTPVGIVGWLFLVGFLLTALRLLYGYHSLKRLVRKATPLHGTAAEEALAVLAAEQQIPHPLKLGEHSALSTAVVIGWWRPVILLPTAWREWNSEQLRAVLAHELAHIRQRDYLTILGAELSRSLYFYHPLVHWLVARLRLEQELSADAAAATSTSGGAESYLVVLAEMAVSQSNHRLTGPARAFLPTQSTFLRRIEMLKQKRSPKNVFSRPQRVMVVCAMLAIGLLAMGLRGNQISLAQQPTAGNEAQPAEGVVDRNKKVSEKRTPFAIDMVPNNALGVLALRPAELLSQQVLKMARTQLAQAEKEYARFYPLDIPLSEIQLLTLILLPPEAGQTQNEMLNHVAVIQTTRDLEQVTKSFGGGGKIISAVTAGGVHYFQSQLYPGYCLSVGNDHELIVSPTLKGLEQVIEARTNSKSSRWTEPWSPVAQDSIATLFNLRQYREMIWKEQRQADQFALTWKDYLTPVWEHVDLISLGVNLERSTTSLQSTFYQQQNGEEVHKTLDAVHVIGANLLQQVLQEVKRENEQELVPLVKLALALINSIQFAQTGENVTLTATLSNQTVLTNALASLVTAMIEVRKASLRIGSLQNLKQLVLAMHLYHDKHKHFPSAVIMGPDGKTPHSWRVALLPYLDQEKLYQEYRLNEPWDSEHNKQILAKMPEVFNNPTDNRPGHLTSYLAVVGPNTVFGKPTHAVGGAGIEMSTEAFVPGGLGGGSGVESKPGPSAGVYIRQITDGTSNTIAIVEATREIPWTKPEDISFDGKTVPELGGFYPGGFCVGLCDGSADFFPETIKLEIFRDLLLINDGHLNKWPSFH